MLLPCNHCDYIGCLPGYVLLCIGKWTASTGYTHISTHRCQRCILFPVLGIILSVVSFPLLIHEQLDQNANNSVKNVMISSFTPNYPKGTRHSPFSNKWIKMNMKFPKIPHKHIKHPLRTLSRWRMARTESDSVATNWEKNLSRKLFLISRISFRFE